MVLTKLYQVTNIFDRHIVGIETTALLKVFEVFKEMHFFNFFKIKEILQLHFWWYILNALLLIMLIKIQVP